MRQLEMVAVRQPRKRLMAHHPRRRLDIGEGGASAASEKESMPTTALYPHLSMILTAPTSATPLTPSHQRAVSMAPATPESQQRSTSMGMTAKVIPPEAVSYVALVPPPAPG